MTTSRPMTQLDLLISSPGATHASHSLLPGSEQARTTTAISGLKCYEQSQQLGLDTLLVKTLLVTSRWGSTRCYLTWKLSATPAGRSLFRLVPSMPDTDEIESGLWQTPLADDAVNRKKGKVNSRGEPKLSAQVLLPTPSATPYGSNQGGGMGRVGPVRHSLSSMAKHGMWPTMTRASASGNAQTAENPTPGQTGGTTLPGAVGGALNPTWVEWLMGYPEGWTDLED